jgi:HD-GYP domain-containing protein (c-di-GMP phosphodiesterase class II)
MTETIEMSLFDLVNCLSEAIDLINPRIMSHHKRVAYIAGKTAEAVPFDREQLEQIFIASSLHDIGAISYSVEEKKEMADFDIEKPHKHSVLGYLLLKEFELFAPIARIIRFHHVPWVDGLGRKFNGEPVPRESHLIHLADRVDILTNRNTNILDQIDSIRDRISAARKNIFDPELVDAFMSASERESFWLDLVSPQLVGILQKMVALPSFEPDFTQLSKIAKLFSHIIDFRSQFTATHSSGVAAVAESLARLDGVSEPQAYRIRIAGYLHDIGKLAIPNEVLDKKEPLTVEEFNIIKRHSYYTQQVLSNVESLADVSRWASSHHEKLDGTGYPFRYRGEELDRATRILTVADIFTALTEDRPYRAGMAAPEVKQILNGLVTTAMLDEHCVRLLEQHYDEVNRYRIEAQAGAAAEYEQFWAQAKQLLYALQVAV